VPEIKISNIQLSSGVSPVIATTFMLMITILIAALLMLLLRLPADAYEQPPALFAITDIDSIDDVTGNLNYDSRIELINKGTESYQNDDLSAFIYRNNYKLDARITTINGYLFIKTVHIGVQSLSGSGTRDITWKPGEKVTIDLTDNTLHPGDKVSVEVIKKSSKTVISRDSRIA